MIHTHDVLRQRLMERAGLADPPTICTDWRQLYESEWSHTFDRLRRERMVIGSYRYGRASLYNGSDRNLPKRAIRRIELYRETGNAEYLVDAANFLMIEFEWEGPRTNPRYYFQTVHDGHDRSRL